MRPEPLFIAAADYAERMAACANRALCALLDHPDVTGELCLFVIDSTTDPNIRDAAAKKLICVVQDPEILIEYSRHSYFQERYRRLTTIQRAIVIRLLKAVRDTPSDKEVGSLVRLVIKAGSCSVYQRTLNGLTMQDRKSNPYFIALSEAHR